MRRRARRLRAGRRCSGAYEGCGVDQALIFDGRAERGLTVAGAANVDGGLLLVGHAPHEVKVAGTLHGERPAGDMLERVEIVENLGVDGRQLHVARRVCVLRLDEGASLCALCVFKPAVAVSDPSAEVVVGDGSSFNGGRIWKDDAIAAVNGLAERDETEKECGDKPATSRIEHLHWEQNTRLGSGR